MGLVVDPNDVMSALAKDAAVREAVRTTADDLYTPWYVRTELDRHRDEIRGKSRLSASAFDTLVENLFRHVETVSREELTAQSQSSTGDAWDR